MALSLKVAELYADLIVKDAQFFARLAAVQAALAGIKAPPITPVVNAASAKASLNLLLQQLKAVQAQAKIKVSAQVPRGGGGGGGGAGLGFAGMGAFAGMAHGLGLPFAANPQMLAAEGIGAGLKASVSTAIDLEAKFAEVRRVAGLSADETERLKRELMAISTVQPGATLDDLIMMAEIGGRMGLAKDALKEFASALAMVKNSVSGLDTEDLANNMARVLTVFKLGPEYVKGFGSALTAMDNATSASAADILKITQGLSGTAAQIGLTLPQVIALSAELRNVGLTPAVASTSFSQIFRKMATNMDDFARVAGVDAKVFADAYRKDPMQALGMLMRSLNQNKDTIEVQGLLKELGLEGLRVGGSLLQMASAFEKLGPLIGQANSEFTTLKALLDADAIKGDTTAAALGKVQNAATGLADSAGSTLLPFIKNATDAFLAWSQAIDQAKTGMDQMPVQQVPGVPVPVPTLGGLMGLGSRFMEHMADPTGVFKAARDLQAMQRQMATRAAQVPALPARPAFVPPKPPDVAGLHAIQGLASRLGLTVNRATEKGGLDFSVRKGGGGLLGGGAGQVGMGLLTGNLGAKLGGLNQLTGGAGGDLARVLIGALKSPEVARPSAQVGLTGAEFGRQLQQDILNGKKADEQLGEIRNGNSILAEMRELLRKAGGNAANALLGPE